MSLFQLMATLRTVGDTASTMAEQVTTAASQISTQMAAAAANAADASQSIQDSAAAAAAATEDLYTHAGKPLEEYITHQRDAIDKIENTLVGGYLDTYVKEFQKLQTLGSSISDIANRDRINRELYDPILGIQRIVADFGGMAGRLFNFQQLEADIKEMLRVQKAQADAAKKSGKPLGGTTSTGGNGSPSTPACGGDANALQAGVYNGGMR